MSIDTPGRRWADMEPEAQRETSESVSRLQHALSAGVHLFFFDEFAACNLVDANLYLLLEPLMDGQEVWQQLPALAHQSHVRFWRPAH